ncbi:HlyD family type I secretion periplasmic adaptor subunit [Sphingomonas aerophila]|uniref:Membrane fusion protein (MFP) family protein n=1 Tax=Sphingomonas aerophila TaxID=1344948 RepID=A0A7W9EXK9_9SPHN|nr:HlyD family type I secretion periplasmic adaptor subunit [Sphingomonas aerophila]MBB5716648.1 HlyD family secretion protein [Sphingomonas aerophila]
MATNLPARLTTPDWQVEHYDPEMQMRRRLRTALLTIGALVVAFVALAVFIPIGGAVVGGGQVGVESRVKRIAHPIGGTIAAIYVRNGDHVNKGDILMRLDDKVTGSQSELSSLTVDQLTAQRARLEAERLGTGRINFPAELRARNDAGARQAMADEEKLYRIRRAEEGGMRAQLEARVAQNRKQIDGYEAQIRALQKQAALIEPERKGVKELWEKDLVTISRVNQLERTSADMEGSIAALQAQIAQTQARITEANEQLIQLGQTRRSDAGTQLATINGSLNQEQIRSVNAADIHERSVIRAPYSGTVDKLAFATIGDVIRPAETIMEIVPDQDRLLVEAMVSPGDIDQVQTGQDARIRFTAFNSTATPEITGRVMLVAPERTNDQETRQSYFAVRIEVDQADLARWPELKLRPGMPAEVFIATGSRSMLSYMTKPLRDQFARAFRDN